jgi:hypothetical protein
VRRKETDHGTDDIDNPLFPEGKQAPGPERSGVREGEVKRKEVPAEHALDLPHASFHHYREYSVFRERFPEKAEARTDPEKSIVHSER